MEAGTKPMVLGNKASNVLSLVSFVFSGVTQFVRVVLSLDFLALEFPD